MVLISTIIGEKRVKNQIGSVDLGRLVLAQLSDKKAHLFQREVRNVEYLSRAIFLHKFGNDAFSSSFADDLAAANLLKANQALKEKLRLLTTTSGNA